MRDWKHDLGLRAMKILNVALVTGCFAAVWYLYYARTMAVQYYARGDYASIVEAAGCAGAMGAVAITPVKTPPLELYCMLAQSALGDEEVARETLARVLHECPYNVELYNAVRNYIVDEGLADEFALIYNAEARRANGLAVSGRASWLSNQQFIALI